MSNHYHSGRYEEYYRKTLQRVLWGDDKDQVISDLTAGGLHAGKAASIYKAAFRERVWRIRIRQLKRIATGVLFLGIAVVVLLVVRNITAGIRSPSLLMIILLAAPGAFGAWSIISGLVGVLTAAWREGAVSGIE